jgi:hypothetical protein
MTPEDELELKVLTDAEAHPRVSTTYKAVHGTGQTHEVTTAIRLASDEPAKIEIDQVPQRIGFVVRVLGITAVGRDRLRELRTKDAAEKFR